METKAYDDQTVMFPDGNLEMHDKGTHTLIANLKAERDDERRRAEAAEREWNVTGGLLGACEKERDALKAEVARLQTKLEQAMVYAKMWREKVLGEPLPFDAAPDVERLRDDVEEVIVLLSDTEHTDNYAARTAGKHLLDMALNPEDLPFVDGTVSDHAQTEWQPCPLCGTAGEYLTPTGKRVFPCNACGGAGVVEA